MNLEQPFYRFPLRFDLERLREEVLQFSDDEWRVHPSNYAGNSALPLISAGGESNDDMAGAMRPTLALERCPYIRQILASFDTVWGRSRLMRLAPGHPVPPHTDLHYYWFNRVRIHIPIVTHPDIRFECGDTGVHMRAGEAWTFDNWRRHRVLNPSDVWRIHLTADTTGSAAFWRLVERSPSPPFAKDSAEPVLQPYRPGQTVRLRTERNNLRQVMHPGEVELLVERLLAVIDRDATPPETVQALAQATRRLCRDWRCTWSEFGEHPEGLPHYERLREVARAEILRISEPAPLTIGGSSAPVALHGQLLKSLVHRELSSGVVADAGGAASRADPSGSATVSSARAPQLVVVRQRVLDKPVFIVSAPRSGSTLLFETLARAADFWTIGGESHRVFEAFAPWRPGADGVDSNRLVARNAEPDLAKQLRWAFTRLLRDREGKTFNAVEQPSARMLEKTPKNALRVPFLNAVFPNSRFIWLYREPRDNISSIIDAWNSGRFVTYRQLPGFDGEWSLLLPPGWRKLTGRSVAERAAFQWRSANQYLLDDLANIPRQRWTWVRYEDFVADPAAETERLCDFADVAFDDELREYVSGELALSRYTLAEPAEGKWRANAEALSQVLPALKGFQRSLDLHFEAGKAAVSR